MTDICAPEIRRRTMQRIRKKDTKPELLVRSVLHRLGLRFRLHRRSLPGVPDIVLPRHKIVVLVHGCFWHQHSCKLGKLPKSNLSYWVPKLKRNQTRDIVNEAALRDAGWKVVTIWECEARNRDEIERFFRRRLPRNIFLSASKRLNKRNVRLIG